MAPDEMLLAEQLLLLFLDDETGALRVDATSGDYALGGALLMELVLAERVHLEGEKGWFRRPHVTSDRGATAPDSLDDPLAPLDALDPLDPLLARALDVIDSKDRSAQDLVPRLAKGLRQEVLDRLVDKEVLRRQDGRILGLFPTRRYPTVDARPEAVLRERLRAALLIGLQPDVRTAALVALLASVDQAPKVLGEKLDRATARQVKDRAAQLAAGSWVPAAVREAVTAVQAATAAAVVAATAATTVAASS